MEKKMEATVLLRKNHKDPFLHSLLTRSEQFVFRVLGSLGLRSLSLRNQGLHVSGAKNLYRPENKDHS